MKLPIYIYQRIINNNSIELFKRMLFEVDWHKNEVHANPDEAYKTFLHYFLVIYDRENY